VNITEAQVSQVEKRGDAYAIPPIIVCKRHLHLALTVLYDLMQYGESLTQVAPLKQRLDVPPKWTRRDIEQYIELNSGRIVIDEWLSPVGWTGHIEPVETQP